MDTDKFISLVERMREAQASYFKSKDRRMLQRSIILEGLVDEEIKNYKTQKKKESVQLELFQEKP